MPNNSSIACKPSWGLAMQECHSFFRPAAFSNSDCNIIAFPVFLERIFCKLKILLEAHLVNSN